MSLSATEYLQNGLVFDSSKGGAMSVTVYSAGSASTYHTANGFLLDSDGRLVVVQSS